jgi:serine protease Do
MIRSRFDASGSRRAIEESTMMSLRHWRLSTAAAAVLATITLVACSGAELGATLQSFGTHALASPAAAATTSEARAAAATLPPAPPAARATAAVFPDFTALVENEGKAVVNVRVAGVTRAGGPQSGGDAGTDSGEAADDDSAADLPPGLREFFRGFGQGPGQVRPREMPTRGIGSGFIISPDGNILTNAHVVANAREVIVKLVDRREFRARVVGIDRRSDVALIKVDAHDLPAVRIGNPAALKTGEWVAAIGSPFGFENTVTSGIVSAKARAMPGDGYVPFIQTDVPINPGNSGGPLFNMAGEVVGINSQIYTQSGGYMGISFAIPIDVAIKVKQQLAEHGRVRRSQLAIGVQEIDQNLARSFGLDSPHGALVGEVKPDGPGAAAGLKSGDVILSIDGTPIATTSDLQRTIADAMPGSRLKLSVWRERKTIELSAQVAEVGGGKQVADAADGASKGRLGVAVRPLQKGEAAEAGVDGGLLVEQVSGAAERAGLQPGDVILSAGAQPLRSVAQLQDQVRKAKGQIALLVMRDGSRLFVPVELG